MNALPALPSAPPRRSPGHTRANRSSRTDKAQALPVDSLAYALARAAELVAAVLEGGSLTLAYEHMRTAHPAWPASVRGAVRDLAWSCLRAYGCGYAILRPLLRTSPPAIIQALLLVSVERLRQRPEQAHTTVDQAVSAAATLMPALKAMVNGVLRNALRSRAQWVDAIAADENARHAHPSWWSARLRRQHPQQAEAALAAGNLHPPMAVRVNSRRLARAEALSLLAQAGIACRELDNGALLLDRPCAVSELPGFADGLLSVQDAGAQWAAIHLDARDGECVLDACAAPGGKSAHVLERADVELLALEVNPLRTRQLAANFTRLDLNAAIKVADCSDLASWWNGKPFDRILADVPCTASGVARRHPDIKWLRRETDIERFAAQQAKLLDALWRTLASGGTMLYVTCSIFDEENAAQIARFCTRHADAQRIAIDGSADRQLFPSPEHDGFYFALLRKLD